MRMCWVHFGNTSWIVDEYGQRRGLLKPIGVQTHIQRQKTMYEPSRAFSDCEYKFFSRPPDGRNKSD